MNLGTLYANGDGVQQDPLRAAMWFRLAASTGNEAAVPLRDGVENRLNTAQRAQVKSLAAACQASGLQDCAD